MKIKLISFKGLHNEEHFQFQTIFSNLVQEYIAGTLKSGSHSKNLYLPVYKMKINVSN